MIAPLFLIPIATLYVILCFRAVVYEKFLDGRMYKVFTLTSFYFNLFYSVWLWNTFPRVSLADYELCFPADFSFSDAGFIFELQPTTNLPFIMLSTFILIVGLLTAWYTGVNNCLLVVLLLIIEVCLVGAFSSTSLFIFLLFFELSALPIFILITYCGSPRRERIKAAYYFLTFTFYGSISLLIVLLNIYGTQQVEFIFGWDTGIDIVLWALLFVAFAVKVPLVPFHIWLPYAHVEASTTASIILAALLLKLGGYGILKFLLPSFGVSTHIFFQPAAIFICLFGLVYGALCALRQIDMKRQIAFSSVSHMSFAMLGIFTYTEIGIKGGFYLMVSHGLTSAALFFLVGVLSDRHHTRSIFAYGGLLATMPMFIFFLVLISLANVGFPGTSGFVPEFFILVGLVSADLYLLFPTLMGMFVSTAAGLLIIMRVAYGHIKIYSGFKFSDMTKLETFVLSLIAFLIIWLGLNDPWSGILLSGSLISRARKDSSLRFLFIIPLTLDSFLLVLEDIFKIFLTVGPELILFVGSIWYIIRFKSWISLKKTYSLLGFGFISSAVAMLTAQIVYRLVIDSVEPGLSSKFYWGLLVTYILLVIAVCLFILYNLLVKSKPFPSVYVPIVTAALLTFTWFGLEFWGMADFSKFGYMINITTQSTKLVLLYLYITVFIIIGCYSRVKDYIVGKNLYEYFIIFWVILIFSMMLVSIDNLVSFLIALEGVSLAAYILPTLGERRGGVIAAVKYFAFGTLGSVYILWGIANLYTVYPDLSISGAYAHLINFPQINSTFCRAVQFIFIGLLIKLGAAPAHQWVPDVYAGASLKITFLFATFIKTLLFFLFWRFAINLNSSGEIEIAAGLSVIIGCYYSLRQKEIKRFLAYSSITHTGFLLMGDILSAGLYLLLYIIAVILFFSVLFEYRIKENLNNDIFYLTDLRYLNIADRPLHSLFLIVSLASMAGLPPFGGFYAKFWIFNNLIEDIIIYGDVASYMLFIVVIVASIISMFYYLRIVTYLLTGSASLRRNWLILSDKDLSPKLLFYDYNEYKSVQFACLFFLILSAFWVPMLIGWLIIFVL